VGRPQTIVVDLRRPQLRGVQELRILTNMRIRWDRIAVAAADDRPTPRTALPASAAVLRWRGFSAEISPDGREPFGYDYSTVSSASPWKTMPGEYTAEGDVAHALAVRDDEFVVMRPGDEVSLSFDAREAPALPAGYTRTFLLYADGFSKEMDVNSESPDRVAPLPSHGDAGVLRPRPISEPAPRVYKPTRTVTTPLPSIDSLLLDAQRPPSR
jgi:hypothetical protein